MLLNIFVLEINILNKKKVKQNYFNPEINSFIDLFFWSFYNRKYIYLHAKALRTSL